MSERILIIGSGAVGAVYGYHLQQAGCEVAYLVRNPASPNARMPRDLYQYRYFGEPQHRHLDAPVLTQATADWDQVWLTLPSEALQSPWLAEQLAVFGADTPLISWTPNFRDRETLSQLYKGPIQHGLIGLISFHTPLPGHQSPPEGWGYYLPPRSAMLDDSQPGKRAAKLLKAGGYPAVSMKNLPWVAGRATALTIPAISALETAGWSLKNIRNKRYLTMASGASREATTISAHYFKIRTPLTVPLQRPWLFRLLALVAPRVIPIPLETYLHYHFSKVGEQTRLMLDQWIEEGKRRRLPVTKLKELRQSLGDSPGSG
ncbi:MAG: 2-dehydropantoate 2-reductase N-terminal domain-containing protein [Pseudomonadota bacterium]